MWLKLICNKDGFIRSGKLTKALPNPFIFIDVKNSFIDQQLSKI